MELTQDATSVLTPFEMRQLRRFWAIWSLDRLAQVSGVSKTQLSQYENAKNGLTRSQVETCERLLLAAGRERNQTMSRLLGPDEGRDMATAS
jgi:transcriptional regulator with XRE-family HTH domain